MAGVDPLSNLIRAPGHSPVKLHAHPCTHTKALSVCNNTLSVLATGAKEDIPLYRGASPPSLHLEGENRAHNLHETAL